MPTFKMLCNKFTHCKGQDARFTIIQISKSQHTDSLYLLISSGNFSQTLGNSSSFSVHIHRCLPFTIEGFCTHSIVVSLSLSWSCVLTDGWIQSRTSGWSIDAVEIWDRHESRSGAAVTWNTRRRWWWRRWWWWWRLVSKMAGKTNFWGIYKAVQNLQLLNVWKSMT